MHWLTARHSKCLTSSVCVLAEQPVAPTNSSPVVPATTISSPHRPRHARSILHGDHPAVPGLYERVSGKSSNLGKTNCLLTTINKIHENCLLGCDTV